MNRVHVIDGKWWIMPGAPDPRTSWPGTKNAHSHHVWLSEPVHDLLPEVIAAAAQHGPDAAGHAQHLRQTRGQREGDAARFAPDVLLQVTALGFGREAMNRVTNHKEGGIADVYDRHRYQEENKKIMETVAAHLVATATSAAGVVAA